MATDYVFMIPHLSKELNLFGLPSLPYTLAKTDEVKSKCTKGEDTPNIVFNSKSMIQALINVCFELIKQVKTSEVDEDSIIDKLNFDNIKLEKQLKQCKLEIDKKINELKSAHKTNQELQENKKELETKLRNYQVKLKSFEKKNQTDINLLKHALKKKESELFESFKVLKKQSSRVEQCDLEINQLNQSDFSKLWSKVKYSDAKTREEALKEAVCIFQNNNKALIEKEFSFKTLLSSSLERIHETLKFMVNKMQFPHVVLPSFKNESFWNAQGFNVTEYNKILDEHLKIFKEVFELCDKASFVVSDDLFVCLSHVFKNLKIS